MLQMYAWGRSSLCQVVVALMGPTQMYVFITLRHILKRNKVKRADPDSNSNRNGYGETQEPLSRINANKLMNNILNTWKRKTKKEGTKEKLRL